MGETRCVFGKSERQEWLFRRDRAPHPTASIKNRFCFPSHHISPLVITQLRRMCKKKKDVLASNPESKRPSWMSNSVSGASLAPSFPEWSSESAVNGGREAARLSSLKPPSTSSSSGKLSIASIRDFLPEALNIYDFSEILSSTRNSQSRRLKSNSWRCTLRGKDTAVFQRKFLGDPSDFRRRVISSSGAHHKNIVRLLGAALGGEDLFLVYDFVDGASLSECLRNPRNPQYSPIAAWIDRIQIAADIAQGLQYIHHFAAAAARGGDAVHDRIKSSSIMITPVDRRAKICHFGALDLSRGDHKSDSDGENTNIKRSGSGRLKFQGARGYISPEVRQGGNPSQKSDVYAFGIVLLELLTGQEPVKYAYNAEANTYQITALTESARNLTEAHPTAQRIHRLRSWIDPRLKDSFPQEIAEKCLLLAVECVQEQPEKRPTMVRVTAKLSALLIQSRDWSEKLKFPEEVTISMNPR